MCAHTGGAIQKFRHQEVREIIWVWEEKDFNLKDSIVTHT